jgi:hypothetical protein
MNLEEQVTSFELSEKLWKLKAPQNSYFFWTEARMFKVLFLEESEDAETVPKLTSTSKTTRSITDVAAYTVAELGELLPSNYRSWKVGDMWVCGDPYGNVVPFFSDKYEANARAKMLIYLLGNDLIRAS